MANKREKSKKADKTAAPKASKKGDFILSDEELDKVAGGVSGLTVTNQQATLGSIGRGVIPGDRISGVIPSDRGVIPGDFGVIPGDRNNGS